MDREEQRKNAEEVRVNILAANAAMDSLRESGNKWTDEKFDATTNLEPVDTGVYDSMSQIDVMQVGQEIVGSIQDVELKKKFDEQVKAAEPKQSDRRKRPKPESPVAAFNEPVVLPEARTFEDYQDYLDVVAKMTGFAGPEPFAAEEKPRITSSPRGQRIAPPMNRDQMQAVNDGQEVVTALTEFERNMTRFAEAVVSAINGVSRRLDSLTRALESEENDKL